MRLRSSASLMLVVLALTNSCTSASTEPTGDPSTLSFTYSGYRNGTYSVTGFEPDPRTGTVNITPWAGAANITVDQVYTQITSSLPAGTHIHAAEFVFPAGATGTFSLGSLHGGYYFDLLVFEFDPNAGTGERYLLSPATVTITSTAGNHVTGTFSGTAVDSVNARTINVTNGTFNVYLAPQ